MEHTEEDLKTINFSSVDECKILFSERTPIVLKDCPLGACQKLWQDMDYLRSKLSGLVRSVHVTENCNMDFVSKNFQYKMIDMNEALEKAAKGDSTEKVYLRAVNDKSPRTSPTNLKEDFPGISEDFSLPDNMIDGEIFSSVLRLSSGGIRVWTHYDVMDNVYCQVVGHKRAVLWAPDQADFLYLSGDKSQVINIDCPDSQKFPMFLRARRFSADLEPGDILFIPALWFHNMTAKDFGVAVNVFWKELPPQVYDPKDVYGNRDHLVAAKADRMLDNVIKQLENLPPIYKDFYGRKLACKLKKKCCSSS